MGTAGRQPGRGGTTQRVHSFVGKSGYCTHNDNVLLTLSELKCQRPGDSSTLTPDTATETVVYTRHGSQKATERRAATTGPGSKEREGSSQGIEEEL